MPVFTAILPECLMITGIQNWFLTLFHHDIYCRWWDIPSLQNVWLSNIILELFFLQIDEHLPIFFHLRNSTSLKCSFYTQSCYWPINIISKTFLHLFLLVSFTLLAFCCYISNFETCYCHQTQNNKKNEWHIFSV